MLEDAFARYSTRTLVQEGQHLADIEVVGGTLESVPVLAAETFTYALAEGEKVSIQMTGNGFSYAPVEKGQSAGKAHIFVDGSCAGAVQLVYGETVEPIPQPKKSLWERLFGG